MVINLKLKTIARVLCLSLLVAILTFMGIICYKYFSLSSEHNLKMLLPLYDRPSHKEEYPIDMVYLWCDGSDPKFKAKRQSMMKKMGKMTGDVKQNIGKERTMNNDELKYSLRSLEKYANWIRNIYIVTDEQVPDWLNTNNPRIHIVDNKDIIPSQFLPTFNSNVIEFGLHNIKGLSEHFLYGNDDMMFGNPVDPEDFFRDGKPIYFYDDIIQLKEGTISGYKKRLDFTSKVFKSKVKSNYAPRFNHHNIDPYKKSSMKECEKVFAEEFYQSRMNNFRVDLELHRDIYASYAIATNQAYYKVRTRHFFRNKLDLINYKKYKHNVFSKYVAMSKVYRLPRMLEKDSVKLFCVNDDEMATDADRAKFKEIIQEMFPDKSQFEK